MWWLPFLLVVLAAISILFVLWSLAKRRKSLSPSVRDRLKREWGRVLAVRDPSRRVLESEKVFFSLLDSLGFLGSFSEKLKNAGPRFKNADSLWNAHRLRNRIAHEVGFSPDEKQAESAVRAFDAALQPFLR